MGRIEQLKSAFEVIHLLPLTREDAVTILELAQIVVDVDGTEARDEIELFFQVGKLLFQLAEIPDEPVPTFATDQEDEERMFDLATNLKSTPARELAFAVVRTLAEADLEIAPVEDTYLDRLRGVLSISRERADELDFLLRSA
jgi:uncharacterized tellurite resistance protein B-like protein